MKTKKSEKTETYIESLNPEDFIEKISDGSEQAKDILYKLFKVSGLSAVRVLHKLALEGATGEKIVARFNHYGSIENFQNYGD